jgi:hypothetical protein
MIWRILLKRRHNLDSVVKFSAVDSYACCLCTQWSGQRIPTGSHTAGDQLITSSGMGPMLEIVWRWWRYDVKLLIVQ